MSYANDVEFASKNIIELIIGEQKSLSQLQTLLASAEAKQKHFEWDFSTSDMNDDFSDAHVQHAFLEMAKAAQDARTLKKQILEVQQSIINHEVSVDSLCGALLQITRQGISIVHGRLQDAPDGRLVGTTSLKEIVWQGRNQAIHYEENNPHPPVVTLFQSLENQFGNDFSLSANTGKSLAKRIIDLLEWHNLDKFNDDMQALQL